MHLRDRQFRSHKFQFIDSRHVHENLWEEKKRPKLCFKYTSLEALGSSENTEGRIPKCQYNIDCIINTALKIINSISSEFCQFWTTDLPEVFETTKFKETQKTHNEV